MLKSLEEHDKERMEAYGQPKRTGIACPVCGEETVEAETDARLVFYPPRIDIFCISCPWRGTCLV